MPFKDKSEQAASAAKHYATNKKIMKDRAKAHRLQTKQRNRQALLEYFLSHPCVVCGESDPLVLCFDHVDRAAKKDNVACMVTSGASWQTILKEIDKCVIRCHNCHARKTAKEQGWHKLLAQKDLGVEQSGIARQPHKLEVAGSNPASRTRSEDNW